MEIEDDGERKEEAVSLRQASKSESET